MLRRPPLNPAPPRRSRLGRRIDVPTLLAVAGNLAFLVGSLLFLSEASQREGVWLFVFGSASGLLATLGSFLGRGTPPER